MNSRFRCFKYSMFLFNFLIFLGGLTIFGAAIWIHVDAASFKEILTAQDVNAPASMFDFIYLMMVVGGVTCVIGFLGCYGAMAESKCFLIAFLISMVCIFVVQLVGGILAFTNIPAATDLALQSMTKYGQDPVLTEAWDSVQNLLDCCGVSGISDWSDALNGTAFYNDSISTCPTRTAADVGCLDAIIKEGDILGAISLSFLVLELMAIIFSFCLYRHLDNKY